MYIKGTFLHYGDALDEIFDIRKKVFQDELGVSEKEERTEDDIDAIHAVAYKIEDEKTPVATGRIIIENGKYKIGRIAVLKEERGKQYGDFIVKMLVNKGFLSGAEEVYVGALKHAISFYKKIGFEECGEPYTDMGMLHYPMKISQGGVCKKCSQT